MTYDIARFLDAAGLPYATPWQRQLMAEILDGRPIELDAARIGGRGNGKATAYRWGIEYAATLGEHAHAAARDGTWCVTRHISGTVHTGDIHARPAEPAVHRTGETHGRPRTDP